MAATTQMRLGVERPVLQIDEARERRQGQTRPPTTGVSLKPIVAPHIPGPPPRVPLAKPDVARVHAAQPPPPNGVGGIGRQISLKERPRSSAQRPRGPRYSPEQWASDRRRVVLGSHIDLDLEEPPIETLADFEGWKTWAHKQGKLYAEHVHARKETANGDLEPFPLFGTTPHELGRAMGVGVFLYFDLLKLLAGFFFIGFVISFPSLLLNITLGSGSDVSLTGIPFPGESLYKTTIAPRIGCDTEVCRVLSLVTGVLDAMYVLLLLWAITSFARRIRWVEQQVDRESTTITDYSVQLSGFPKGTAHHDILSHVEGVLKSHAEHELALLGSRANESRETSLRRAYFTDFLARRLYAVHEIVPLLDDAGLLKAALDKVPVEAEVASLEKAVARQRLICAELAARGSFGSGLGRRRLRAMERRLHKKRRKLDMLRKNLAKFVTGTSDHTACGIVVSFHFEMGKVEALRAFPNDEAEVTLEALHIRSQDTRFRGSGSGYRAIRATPLEEPADLILENFAFRGSLANLFRRGLSTCVVLFLLSAGFMVFLWARVTQQRALVAADGSSLSTASGVAVLASIVAVATNAALKRVVRLVVRVERHTLRSDVEKAVTSKVFLAQFANMALLLPLVASAVPSWIPSHACWTDETQCVVDGICCVFGERGLVFRGSSDDLSHEWFASVGSKVLLTMGVQLFAVALHPVMRKVRWHAHRVFGRDDALTLEAVLKLHEGEQMDMAKRHGELLAFVAVVLIYAPGMPLLYAFGTTLCVAMYWVRPLALEQKGAWCRSVS